MSELQELQRIFNIFWLNRHEGIVHWQGGFVYPRDELKKIIRSLRRLKNHV